MDEQDRESEIESLRSEIAALRKAREEDARTIEALRSENARLQKVYEELTIGVAALDAKGAAFVFNAALRTILGRGPTNSRSPEERIRNYGMFETDGKTRITPDREPGARALRGERVIGWEGVLRNPATPDDEIRILTDACPFHDEEGRIAGIALTIRNVTEERRVERESEAHRTALDSSEAAREALVARLRAAVESLETPILQVGRGILVMPVIGVVDSQRSARMTSRLLDAVTRLSAHYVIVDWTGVDLVDTATAGAFLDMARAVGLLGACCVLTGLAPAVARTLVDLDVAFGDIPTLRNLEQGLAYCTQASRRASAARPASG